jgi:hypothetical protein
MQQCILDPICFPETKFLNMLTSVLPFLACELTDVSANCRLNVNTCCQPHHYQCYERQALAQRVRLALKFPKGNSTFQSTGKLPIISTIQSSSTLRAYWSVPPAFQRGAHLNSGRPYCAACTICLILYLNRTEFVHSLRKCKFRCTVCSQIYFSLRYDHGRLFMGPESFDFTDH